MQRSQENLAVLQGQLGELEAEFEGCLSSVRSGADDAEIVCEELAIRPRKSDLAVERVALVWTPWRVGAEGIAEPAY